MNTVHKLTEFTGYTSIKYKVTSNFHQRQHIHNIRINTVTTRKAKLCWRNIISCLIIAVYTNCRIVSYLVVIQRFFFLKKTGYHFCLQIKVSYTCKNDQTCCSIYSVRGWVVFVLKLTDWELLKKIILPCTKSHVTPI